VSATHNHCPALLGPNTAGLSRSQNGDEGEWLACKAEFRPKVRMRNKFYRFISKKRSEFAGGSEHDAADS
jgi:hypothetical protein